MPRPALAILAVFLIAPAGGCLLCEGTDLLVGDAGDPMDEFADPSANWDRGDCAVAGGSFTGEVTVDGARWRRFEFPDALDGGPPRLLEVLLPSDSGGGQRARLGETTDSRPAVAPAKLVVRPGPRLIDWPSVAIGPVEHAVFLEVGSDECLGYSRPPGATPGPGGWVEFRGDADLKWRERNRVGYVLLHALYAPAFVLDVATLPLQFLLLLSMDCY